MKKVGIITFHSANNFGAILQCYALQCIINKLGLNAEIIDYRPESITLGYKAIIRHPITLIKIKGFFPALKRIFNISYIIKINNRNKKFNLFRKQVLNISPKTYFTFEQLYKNPPLYDCYVTGSDQVWNINLTKGLDKAFFLEFCPGDKKRIAYGASIGETNSINNELNLVLKNYIKKLDYISVREKTAMKFLETLVDKTIYNVLDPTLLLSSNEWDCIAIPPKINKKYLLLYDLQYNKEMNDFSVKLADRFNLDIISFNPGNIGNNTNSFFFSGPREFLGLVKNAEVIITNSFHGTVFSLIYHKPFYTFPHSIRGERMIDLLESLDLKNRILYNDTDVIDFDINYELVEKVLNIEKDKSINFIKMALR